MKFNPILVSIVFLLFFSCTIRKPQNNIDLLFRRWKIDYVEMNGKKLDEIGNEEGEFEYEFRKDHSYSIFSTKENESRGKWEWNDSENCVYFRNELGNIEGKIVNIEKNKITLIPTPEIGDYPQFELVKFHYIPKY